MHVLRLLRIFIPLLLLAAIVAGSVLVFSSRSDLERARKKVETTWQPLHDALNTRYSVLAVADAAVLPVPGPLHQVAADVKTAYTEWSNLGEQNGSVTSEVNTANNLEALGRRLVLAARAAPRLAGNTTAMGPVNAFAALAPPASSTAFDDAVGRFERARNRPARRFAARVLGYDTIPAYDVSAAS